MSQQTAFDPSRYLTKVGAADYLEVKWRLVWLREMHPDAAIETEMASNTEKLAVFKARVSIPGGGSATGWGSETPGDFRDFLEKAETKAIGRALAALGFGTQFCDDFNYGTNPDRPVVDAPVHQPGQERQPTPFPSNGNGSNNGQRPQTTSTEPMTDKQLKMIWRTAGDQGIDGDTLHVFIKTAYGTDTMDSLTKRDASALIDLLMNNPQRVSSVQVASGSNLPRDPYP